MTVRIDIPETNQFIEVKDASELNHGDLKAVAGAVSVEIVDQEAGRYILPGNMDDLSFDMLAARSITNWNLPHPLPKGNPARLDILTQAQYKALKDGLADHVKAINADRPNPDQPGTDPTTDSAI